MNKNLELIITKDGSHSIYNSALNETYHSVGGAIQESEHIYIQHGFKSLSVETNPIKILEIGFGTGLNAILTLKEAVNEKLQILYTTLEPYPLSEEIIKALNYPSYFRESFLKEKFFVLHSCPWEENNQITPDFLFIKEQIKIEEFNTEEKFDLVYYDAFAPSKQADIWDINNLKKVKDMMKVGGILITYCSNGKFKRDLKEAGFTIESLPGPLGKREITRAVAVSH